MKQNPLSNIQQTISKLTSGLDLSPIQSDVVDVMKTGSYSDSSSFSNTIQMPLTVSKNTESKSLNNVFFYLTKSPNGTFNIHMLCHTTHNTMLNNKPFAQPVYVSVPVFDGTRERTVQATGATVTSIGNANINEVVNAYTSPAINTLLVAGNVSETFIPVNLRTLSQTINLPSGESVPFGRVLNMTALTVWKQLKTLQTEETMDADDKVEKMQALWNKYLTAINAWIHQGLLVRSSIIYANENGVQGAVTATPGTSVAAQPSLNAPDVYSALRSFVPTLSRINVVAHLTDTVETPNGFIYGIYPASVTKENKQTLTDPEMIAKTVEIASRELKAVDGAGNPVFLSVIVRDTNYGRGLNKRSRSFGELQPGTRLLLQGEVQVRNYQKGTDAIRFEVSNAVEYQIINTNNNVVGSFESETDDFEIDLDQVFVQVQDATTIESEDLVSSTSIASDAYSDM